MFHKSTMFPFVLSAHARIRIEDRGGLKALALARLLETRPARSLLMRPRPVRFRRSPQKLRSTTELVQRTVCGRSLSLMVGNLKHRFSHLQFQSFAAFVGPGLQRGSRSSSVSKSEVCKRAGSTNLRPATAVCSVLLPLGEDEPRSPDTSCAVQRLQQWCALGVGMGGCSAACTPKAPC